MTCYYCKSCSIDEDGGGWCDISGTSKKLATIYHKCSFFEFDTGIQGSLLNRTQATKVNE